MKYINLIKKIESVKCNNSVVYSFIVENCNLHIAIY